MPRYASAFAIIAALLSTGCVDTSYLRASWAIESTERDEGATEKSKLIVMLRNVGTTPIAITRMSTGLLERRPANPQVDHWLWQSPSEFMALEPGEVALFDVTNTDMMEKCTIPPRLYVQRHAHRRQSIVKLEGLPSAIPFEFKACKGNIVREPNSQ